jgi:hypothetical protein
MLELQPLKEQYKPTAFFKLRRKQAIKETGNRPDLSGFNVFIFTGNLKFFLIEQEEADNA